MPCRVMPLFGVLVPTQGLEGFTAGMEDVPITRRSTWESLPVLAR